ncbi:hypothetical protein BD779DRAFT_173013 [Infundibulicybe gibba]|nr:hypothetical protein BD779DRAFT_173013 [Infundibulicybe gibba]
MILLSVAQTSTSSCRTLCEVSSWVRQLALPVFYTTVVLDTSTLNLGAFSRCMVISSPPACLPDLAPGPANFVRHIWASGCGGTNFAPVFAITKSCKNATHFALDKYSISAFSAAIDSSISILVSGVDYWKGTVMGEGDLHITLLGHGHNGSWELLSADTAPRLYRPLYRRLRRLRLEYPINLVKPLAIFHLTSLTHFAAPILDVTESELNSIFDTIAGTAIEVFVVAIAQEQMDGEERQQIDNWVRGAHKKDERMYAVTPMFDADYLYQKWEEETRNDTEYSEDVLVIVMQPDFKEVYREWEIEVQGGATIWERAVEYTQRLMDRAQA